MSRLDLRSAWALVLAFAAGGPALALDIHVFHAYGELVDRGSVTVTVSATSAAAWPDCAAGLAVTQRGKEIVVALRKSTSASAPPACSSLSATLAPLAAGDYVIVAQMTDAEQGVVDSASLPMTIAPIEGRCNPEPALSPSIWARPKDWKAAAFIARLAADPALAASLGHPTVRQSAILEEVYFDYPPLVDIPPMLDRLVRADLFDRIARNGYACFDPSPPDTIATVLEFRHDGLDQYFYAVDPEEIRAIDAGKVGAWTRTGKTFRVVTMRGCPLSSPNTVVYRFAGKPGIGSHFFTRERAECHAIDQKGQWDFEGIAFYAAPLAADGTCSGGRVPLYRMWRPFGVSNHRFATDPAVVTQMVTQGWIGEGAAMCVLPGER
ncbi:MAG: hypothetical protein U1F48_01190 [Burkholderiales bacterium]